MMLMLVLLLLLLLLLLLMVFGGGAVAEWHVVNTHKKQRAHARAQMIDYVPAHNDSYCCHVRHTVVQRSISDSQTAPTNSDERVFTDQKFKYARVQLTGCLDGSGGELTPLRVAARHTTALARHGGRRR